MSYPLPFQIPERQPPKKGYRYVEHRGWIEPGAKALWMGEPCEVVDPLYISYFNGFQVTGSSTECIVKFADGHKERVERQFMQIKVPA